MKTYWSNLNERERWMVASGVIVLGLYLIYLLLYAPMVHSVQEKKKLWAEKQETVTWMMQIKGRVNGKKATKALTNAQLLTLLASQLNHTTFKKYPYQLKQTSEGDAQLSFEKVPFNAFIQWLWSINQNYAITIKQMIADKSAESGVTQLRILIGTR